MEDNRPTLAQYFVEQACPDNRFLEEMTGNFRNLVGMKFKLY